MRWSPAGLPVGAGAGVGSMPGVDPREAARIVVGESSLVALPELPARGVGADLIGRTASILVDIPVDVVHRVYRLTSAPTTITRRGRDFLRWDLDALEEQWELGGLAGSDRAVKLQTAGPFTFGAQVELRGGHKLVRDRGAVRDVAESLAAGLAGRAAEVERRLGARVVVQIDEPGAGPVVDGTVTPLTRLDPIAPIPVQEVAETLNGLVETIGRPALLHTCAPLRWDLLSLLTGCGLSLDLTRVREADFDRLGHFLDAGGVMAAGIVPSTDPDRAPDPEQLGLRLISLVDRIGLERTVVRDNMLITPTCGLAGASPSWATAALRTASSVAQLLPDLIR
ncbi:MAG: vitamin-B12 independent methionine synthase [Gordonia sp. (in: high G+C Gram-positive bacteria)]